MRYWKPKDVPRNPKVSLIVASFINEDERRQRSLRCLVESIKAQTYANWELIVYHDGPIREEIRPVSDDKRWLIVEPKKRLKQFGHPYRTPGIKMATGDWVGLTNDDNYYMPVYFEWMLSQAHKANADFVYCDYVASHKLWKPFRTEPRRGKLDLGAFLVKRHLALEIPFNNFAFSGDGDWINRLVARCRGRVAKVDATIFVHN